MLKVWNGEESNPCVLLTWHALEPTSHPSQLTFHLNLELGRFRLLNFYRYNDIISISFHILRTTLNVLGGRNFFEFLSNSVYIF